MWLKRNVKSIDVFQRVETNVFEKKSETKPCKICICSRPGIETWNFVGWNWYLLQCMIHRKPTWIFAFILYEFIINLPNDESNIINAFELRIRRVE